MKIVDGKQAYTDALRNKARKYPDRSDARYREARNIFPSITPGFQLQSSQSVFTIGSCFARNVESVLMNNGFDVPTAAFKAPENEAPGVQNRILNQYNPGTMMQCVSLVAANSGQGLYQASEGEFVDCLLATGGRFVTEERAMERRKQISSLYESGLACSDTVVITLGLVEAWFDLQDMVYLNDAPPRKFVNQNPDRFEFRQLGVDQCLLLVDKLISQVLSYGEKQIILTVSPVPLQVTFAGGDVVCRNSYSKSVLRVVAEVVSQQYGQVDYFPSYEMVTSLGTLAYGVDNVHVRPAIVKEIVEHMVELYAESEAA